MGGSAVALEALNPGLIQVSKDSGEPKCSGPRTDRTSPRHGARSDGVSIVSSSFPSVGVVSNAKGKA